MIAIQEPSTPPPVELHHRTRGGDHLMWDQLESPVHLNLQWSTKCYLMHLEPFECDNVCGAKLDTDTPRSDNSGNSGPEFVTKISGKQYFAGVC